MSDRPTPRPKPRKGPKPPDGGWRSFIVRLTPDEYELLRFHAARCNLSLARTVRAAIVNHAAATPAPAGTEK